MSYVLKLTFFLSLLLSTQNGFADIPNLAAFPPAPADHLKCYNIRDALNVRATVNLDSRQFGLEEGCRVTRAVLFCVPTSKTVVQTRIDTIDIHSKPQPGDTICYQVSCPRKAREFVHIADQFGKRTILKEQPRILCAPAVKLPVSTVCGFNEDGTCDGPCPDKQECRVVDSGLTKFPEKQCRCVDVLPPRCGFDANNQCGGECVDTNKECRTVEVDGFVGCGCVEKPVPCGFNAAGQCGGECPNPALQVCDTRAGSTICRCSTPCRFVDNNTCGGDCPNPQQFCTVGSDNRTCECLNGPLAEPTSPVTDERQVN